MSRRKTDGFALIAVLWTLVLLGGIGMQFHAASQTDRQVTANLRAATRARWQARAGLVRTRSALEQLLAGDSAMRVFSSASDTLLAPLRYRLDDIEVEALVLDQRARIRVDAERADALRRLCAALGIDAQVAERLVATVVEAAGEERTFYSLAELRELAGMPGAEFGRVAPYLTVGGDGRINLNSAPLPVLQSLPGIDAAGASAILQRRQQRPLSNLYEVLELLPPESSVRLQSDTAWVANNLAFSPREVRIQVHARASGSPVAARLDASVLLSGGKGLSVLQVIER